ncbi:hypothetical protein LCY76_23390 [Fictibacillus sp. KIGAM418]|uniref:Uncharacterized protein n=1 Tax=Fictibacillus marinisediminis TaxID=2878389 RepID=A0A9X1XEV2_9BACL|nr:hypothetical protein [Fictibacillus marinisediminis]MCK6259519.1 hypothetical protein [Fictibacillus marinisediminis]
MKEIFNTIALFLSLAGLIYFAIGGNDYITILIATTIILIRLFIMNWKWNRSTLIFGLIIAVVFLYGLFSFFYDHPWIKKFILENHWYDYIIISGFLIAAIDTLLSTANIYLDAGITKAKGGSVSKRSLFSFFFTSVLIILIIVLLSTVTIAKSVQLIDVKYNSKLTSTEVSSIISAIQKDENMSIMNRHHLEQKLKSINKTSDIDLFILCVSLILPGMILVNWTNKFHKKYIKKWFCKYRLLYLYIFKNKNNI